MLLGQQVQSLLYHLMMGWFYGCAFSFTGYVLKHVHIAFLKGIGEILFHLLFTILLFYGLFSINGGITNAYLIALFLLGVYIFYRFYYLIFTHIYHQIGQLLRPFFHSLAIAKKKIIGIIRLPIKRLKRRFRRARKKNTTRQPETGEEKAPPT